MTEVTKVTEHTQILKYKLSTCTQTVVIAQGRTQKKWSEVRASEATLMSLALTLEAVGLPLKLVFGKRRDSVTAAFPAGWMSHSLAEILATP